mmetsp:Transcript_24841/g.78550  ORF Transcript_24841/g.78550 Transcript_24841/m.78550 type:complete len:209 (-) Transcript_24841:829-1455(-)
MVGQVGALVVVAAELDCVGAAEHGVRHDVELLVLRHRGVVEDQGRHDHVVDTPRPGHAGGGELDLHGPCAVGELVLQLVVRYPQDVHGGREHRGGGEGAALSEHGHLGHVALGNGPVNHQVERHGDVGISVGQVRDGHRHSLVRSEGTEVVVVPGRDRAGGVRPRDPGLVFALAEHGPRREALGVLEHRRVRDERGGVEVVEGVLGGA